MQNVTLPDILTAILSSLTAEPSLVPDTLKQINLGVDADATGYPYCRVYLTDFSSALVDTITYARTYSFAVEIWQEYSQASKETAEINLCTAIDAVMDRLNGDWQLGIGVEKSEIQTSIMTVSEAAGSPIRRATLRFTVTNLVQNPS